MQAIIKHGGKILFVVSIKDCRVDAFRSSGPGGQNKNKVHSAIRVVHEPSGAIGEGKEERDQPKNKRAAFERMVAKPEFVTWVKLEISRIIGREIEERERRTSQKGDKIRTYHEKRGTVTDHRTDKVYDYNEVLNGREADHMISETAVELSLKSRGLPDR
jgi:protein subunit release factor A